ncbi:MAG: DUF1566 domain-containing protein [Ferrovum sp.]|nr:DUF1566 domain-containing protein [Ferrovum sp.]
MNAIAELETIKATHADLAKQIATLEEAITKPRNFVFHAQTIALNPGEEYAGIILGKDGAASHHLILLPGEAESVTFAGAHEFAKKAGGDLPTRREQSLLFANLKDQFEQSWYWSGEQHAADSYSAWFQDFDDGSQVSWRKDDELRARAVRRITI